MLPSTADLATLPEPSILEHPTHAAILQRRLDTFLAVCLAEGHDVGQYTGLESAPEVILLEEASYTEMLFRRRLDEVYKSGLVYYAEGSTLDHIGEGADHGVTRLAGERDPDYRARIRIAARGSSAAGSDDWWIYHAMTADPLVEAVAVTRPRFPIPRGTEQRGHITISVLARTPDGVPDEATLARVRERLTSTAVRNTCAVPTVVAATSVAVDIVARVWLREEAPQAVFDGLEAVIRTAWAAERALGWDVVPSWIAARLTVPGVQKIIVDTPETPVLPWQAPRIGTVRLTPAGRGY